MHKKLVRSMFSIGMIIIVAKALGFLRQVVTGNAFGTTLETDLILLGQGIVLNLDFVISQTLITSFIPIYIAEKKRSEKANVSFASKIIKIVFVLGVVMTLVLGLFSPLLSRVLAPSYTAELSARLAKYIRSYAITFTLIAEIGVFNALMKANERFYAGEMIGIIQSLSFIGCIVLFKRTYGVDTLNIAFFLYVILCFTFLFTVSKKFWTIEKGNPFRDETVKRFIKTTGIVLFGYSMVFVNQQVDKIIVSGMGDGIITSVHYGAVLSNFICTLIASMGGILFTYVTNAIIEGRDFEAASLSFDFARIFTWFLMPITIITWFYSDSIVRLVFGRGEFNEASVYSCSLALKGYCISFVPFVFRELYGRMLYAYEESKHVTVNSTISILTNIMMSICLSRVCGVIGVTIASSIAVTICAILNLYYAHKKNKNVNLKILLSNLVQWVVGFLIFCIIVVIMKKMNTSDAIKIVLTTLICFAITAVLLYKELLVIIDIKKKEGKK